MHDGGINEKPEAHETDRAGDIVDIKTSNVPSGLLESTPDELLQASQPEPVPKATTGETKVKEPEVPRQPSRQEKPVEIVPQEVAKPKQEPKPVQK